MFLTTAPLSLSDGSATNARAMNRTTVFSKTGKGLLEIKNRSNRLSKDQFRVLNLVDGKATLDDLVDKSRITEVELRKVLLALSDAGFIKEFTNPAGNAEYASVTIPRITGANPSIKNNHCHPRRLARPSIFISRPASGFPTIPETAVAVRNAARTAERCFDGIQYVR